MRHRFYSPELRRFLTRDPLGLDGGANLYAYALLNPLALIDPYGLCSQNNWETGSYWGDVGEVFKGYGDTVSGMANGIYQIARHPVQTSRGMASAATHPGRTWGAIKNDYANRSRTLRGQGSIVGEILITAGTVGAGVVNGGGKVGQTAKIINAIDTVVPEEIAPYVDDMVTVSKWGGDALEAGNWVMKGPVSKSTFVRSFKWEPTPWNQRVPFKKWASGQNYTVPKRTVKWPQGSAKWKGIYGQRQYRP